MRLKRLTSLSAILVIPLFLAIISAVFHFEKKLDAAKEEYAIAEKIDGYIADQVSLAMEYSLHGESRTYRQWKSRQDAIVKIYRNYSRQNNIQPFPRLLNDLQIIDKLFERVVRLSFHESDEFSQRQIRLLQEQITMRSQVLMDSLRRQSQVAHIEFDRLFDIFNYLVMSLMSLTVVAIIFVSLLIKYRVLKPIETIHQSVIAVLNGQSEQKIDLDSQDELGDFSRTFNEKAIDLVTSLQNEIEQRKAMQLELERLATTDGLTGIANRRAFNTVLNKILAIFRRYHQPFCLMMMDIDHFKLVNDTFGHDAGDKVLKEFAEIVKKHIREVDTFARWGGEEFILVLPQTDINVTLKLAERIREQVQANTFSIDQPVTISIGVTLAEDLDSLDSMLERVDNALYEAKESGRNCIRRS